MKVHICGSGGYLPGNPVPFDEIESILGSFESLPPKIEKWLQRSQPVMRELLDIEYVHYGMDPATREFSEDNVSMAVKAARKALDSSALKPEDIDLLCYGSAHQDQMPTASVRIQEELGIEICDEFSIHANCTSAYKALYLGHQLIKNGQNRTALVLSSNMASSELRAEYYNQAKVDKESLFLRWFLSDGAGALILSSDSRLSSGFEIETTFIESIGGKKNSLMFNKRPALWLNPRDEFEQGAHHLRQNFRNALSASDFKDGDNSIFFKGFGRMMARSSVSLRDIRFFQINLPTKHIVDSVAEEFEQIGMSRSVFYSKLNTLGYCGPPMVFLCLDKIIREEQFAEGECFASFVTEVSKFMQAGYVIRYGAV